MTDQELAAEIVKLCGGKDNIVSVRHCATRLRLVTKDQDQVDTEAVENLEKVKGSFFNSGQYQIILGTGLVNRVYTETVKITGEENVGESTEKHEESAGKGLQRAIRVFSDVFVPIIPVLVATGLFMGLRNLITQDAVLSLFGMTSDSISPNLLTFTSVLTDTAFAFLPALVCWSTFRNFGGSPVIGIVLGLMLVNSALPSAYDVGSGAAEPLRFFGFLEVSGYQGSVLPAFVTAIIAARFEVFLRKHVPDVIDLIVTPFLTLLVGSILGLLVLGPILHMVENVMLMGVEALIDLPFGIGGLLLGVLVQLMVIFGIHHILNFLEISMLGATGWDLLNPILSVANVAQAGAVLATGIRMRSNKVRQVAYPACLSAMLGITEPAVFGVNLKYVKPYVAALVGGAVGGWFGALMGLKATGMSLTGIPGILLYLNNQLPVFILANLVAFVVAFVITWFLMGNASKEK